MPTPKPLSASVLFVPVVNETDVKIRLAAGLTQYEGRVEIYYSGVWGTVCDDGFGVPEATVVCRMAGLTYVVISLKSRVVAVLRIVLVQGPPCLTLPRSLHQCGL